MSLPETIGYKLTSRQPFLINIIVILMITSFFTIFEMPFIGLLIGSIIAGVLYIYQRINSPGIIKHYLYYNKLPAKLSGNKRKEFDFEDE
ncbi:MAG: hypothetical protein ACOCP8_08520 [archaeon]